MAPSEAEEKNDGNNNGQPRAKTREQKMNSLRAKTRMDADGET